ncbi:MAG: TonB-dependent receptor, partial [Acidobacteriota bacterium]
NDKFDAKNFFDKPGARIPPYKQNQFGGTLGGPILRGKTFFFGDYEGRRQRVSGTVLSTVPTGLERKGDFSQSFRGAAPVHVYDPFSYNQAANTRQPFPGDVIPAARLDPVGSAAAALYPLPSQAGIVNNFLFNPVFPRTEDKFDVRVDHNFGPNDTVFVRVSYQWADWKEGQNLPAPAFGGSALDNSSRSYAFSHTHIFSPTLFNGLRLGYNQLRTNRLSPTDTNLNKQIGLKGLPFDLAGLASFSVSGFRGLGTMSGNPNVTDSQVRQLKDDLSWMRGRHNAKFGLSLTWPQSPQIHHYQANGVFTMNGNFSRQTSNNRDGFSMADLLLGIPYQSQLSGRAQSALRRRLYHGYAQDEFKASDRLTVTLGLRYEFVGPWVDKYNHLANFDIDTDPAKPRLLLAKAGSLEDRSTIKADYLNFAPRLGFAYRVGDRTVLRSGYGIYYGGVEHIGDRYLHAGPPFFFQ